MERVFLNRFIELCSSQMLCVRKSCATNFVKFAAYVRKETFLKSLVSFLVVKRVYSIKILIFCFSLLSRLVSMFFNAV